MQFQQDAPWLLYIFSIVVAMYLHYTLVLLPFITGLILLIGTWTTPFRWRLLRDLIVTSVIIGLFYLPNLVFFLENAEQVGKRTGREWKFPHWRRIYNLSAHVYGQPRIFRGLMLAAIACLLIVAFAVWAKRRQWQWFGFGLVACSWPVIILLVSWLYQPMFLPRVLFWSVIPSRIVAGVGLWFLPFAKIRWLILGVIIAVNIVSIQRIWYDSRWPWGRFVEVIAADPLPAKDKAVLMYAMPFGFNYYWQQQQEDITVLSIRSQPDIHFQSFGSPLAHPSEWRPKISRYQYPSELFDAHQKVWLIFTSKNNPDGLDSVLDSLARGGRLVRSEMLGTKRYHFRFFVYEKNAVE